MPLDADRREAQARAHALDAVSEPFAALVAVDPGPVGDCRAEPGEAGGEARVILGVALDAAARGATNGRLFALPTYTALLELRELLADRGQVERFWERR